MKVICPRCGQSITANAAWAGQMVNCPKCKKKVAIPEANQPAAAEPKADPKPNVKPPAKPKTAEGDLDDGDFQLAPAERRPKMHVTEDELALAPEQPRPKPETLLESTPAPNAGKSVPPRARPIAPRERGEATAERKGGAKAPRKAASDPCPNCGAQLPPDGMLCLECGYHLVLKRVLQTDLRDMDVDSTIGFQRWIKSQLSEGESFGSMLMLLHGVMLVIAVAIGLIFHPHGWIVVAPVYLAYLGFVFWARKSRAYLRWGEAFWNWRLRRNQRTHWKGRRAFISHDRDFNDEALGEVPNLEELEVLDLQGTRISDGALRHIQYCGALKYIVVKGTRMTSAGIERLQIMMPDVSIWA